MITTWCNKIKEELKKTEDSLEDLTFSETTALDTQFEDRLGNEAPSFTAWSKEWVYFVVGYEGWFFIGRVKRHP